MSLGRSFLLGLTFLATASGATAVETRQRHVPVFQRDFPDPFVVSDGERVLAFATNSAGINLPIAESRDLVRWRTLQDPQRNRPLDGMPVLESWVKEGRTWAPEVVQLNGRWHLYYTGHHRASDLQCIGVAVADRATGPYRDTSDAPLVCQFDRGGTIDANVFRDTDGQLYIYYKNDGNRIRERTWIYGQRLSADGMRAEGEPVQLATNDVPWEEHVIEGSTMVRTPGGTGYTMFYSANHFGWETHQHLSPYAMGYARCQTPLGPCIDAPENPILIGYNNVQFGCLSGPGHQSLFTHKGREYLAFHAWAMTPRCTRGKSERHMFVAPLRWTGDRPTVLPSLRR